MNNNYQKNNLKEKIRFANVQPVKVHKILKMVDEAKAPGIDDLFEIFLKDSGTLLTTPIIQ